jgi:N-acetylmuramoyl-L-alanine amidase
LACLSYASAGKHGPSPRRRSSRTDISSSRCSSCPTYSRVSCPTRAGIRTARSSWSSPRRSPAPVRIFPRRVVTGDDAPRPRPAPDPRNQRPAQRSDRWVVIVDAGHGGVDNGMSGPIGGGPKIYEKNITLAVATKLGAALRRRGGTWFIRARRTR